MMIYYSPKEVRDKPNSMVVHRILLLRYSRVGTTPSAEVKLRCCFLSDKSILGVVILKDSLSMGICAGCWIDTLESEGSLRTWKRVCWFRGSSEQDTPVL